MNGTSFAYHNSASKVFSWHCIATNISSFIQDSLLLKAVPELLASLFTNWLSICSPWANPSVKMPQTQFWSQPLSWFTVELLQTDEVVRRDWWLLAAGHPSLALAWWDHHSFIAPQTHPLHLIFSQENCRMFVNIQTISKEHVWVQEHV